MSRPQKPSPEAFPGRRRLFRLAAVVIGPVLLLIAEFALRFSGSGYPTSFFVPDSSSRPGFYRENARFGWRFFPPSAARAPEPIRIQKRKPPGVYRIFVFGESAALGDPEPAYGFSRILRELLEARFPQTRFEVVNVAMTAISSHTIRCIAQDCGQFEGDLWIVYMGNNEVIGPFGPGSAFGTKAPPMALIRADLLFKKSRLGQWIDTRWQARRTQEGNPQQWEGMKMMLQHQFRASDPALDRVYRHFRSNLEDIVKTAKDSGAKTILCSVASNLQECPPFLSLHRPDLSAADEARWQQLVRTGAELQNRGALQESLSQFKQAAAIDGTYAALRFRMARSETQLTNAAAAVEQFRAAQDLDALRFRCDSKLNLAIRSCAAAHAEVRFVDVVTDLAKSSSAGVLGAADFYDHVHFTFAGNYRLAQRLGDEVILLLPESVRSSGGTHQLWISQDECAQRLAYTAWDEHAIADRMYRRFKEPPFTGQLDSKDALGRWAAHVAKLGDKLTPPRLEADAKLYRAAIERRPDDWQLHDHLAFLLEASGALPEAKTHWRRVVELLPDYPDAWYKLGDMEAAAANLTEAARDYGRVLTLRPASFEAMNGLGLVCMSQGKLDEAASLFARALQINPAFAQAHVNWGLLLTQIGNKAEAEGHYREALRCSSDTSTGAHINLANLLTARGQHKEALEHYLQAARSQPRSAKLHLRVADCFLALGQPSEAEQEYAESLRLDPSLPEAHFNLGVLLARKGDLPGATKCFREAARWHPDDAQTLLNLGVALAKQNQLEEAAAQFTSVLRLDPGNSVAQRFLETAAHQALKP